MVIILWWLMQKLFNPKSVALIGATDRVGSVGLGIAKNLLVGAKRRKIFFVNSNSKKVLKQKTFVSILDIKEKIDLAIIAVPAKFVKQVSVECCSAKVGCCIIISSGFAEAGLAGTILQKEIALLFAQNKIPLIGPNCLGVINPHEKLNASFAPDMPYPGKIAFLSQSGALIDSVIDYSLLENFGFSLMISYGNEAGMSLNDFLKIAGGDENTKVIAIYVEEIKNGREFIEIASEITKQKPIIILKGGVTEVGQKAAQSHTAAMAGEAKIYSAAFKKAGVIEVETIRDLFLVAKSR
ncbi:MAG: CoA-binding protein, partial [Candidatus Gribaldobacteria bacterium]|nr:CoA-binding protein [Candidatus Gribaldobacteria bacterium]